MNYIIELYYQYAHTAGTSAKNRTYADAHYLMW